MADENNADAYRIPFLPYSFRNSCSRNGRSSLTSLLPSGVEVCFANLVEQTPLVCKKVGAKLSSPADAIPSGRRESNGPADAIIKKINADAEKQVDAILKKADLEAKEIIKRAQEEAKKAREEIITKGEREAELVKQRIVANANLRARKIKRDVKEALIKSAFDEAEGELRKISSTREYESVLRGIIKEAASAIGRGVEITVRNDDKNILTKNFLSSLSKELNINIAVSQESINTCGGAVVREKNGRVEVNNTLEARIARMKDGLRFKVAKILFEES